MFNKHLRIIRTCKILLRGAECSVISYDDIDDAGRYTPLKSRENFSCVNIRTSQCTCRLTFTKLQTMYEGRYNLFRTLLVTVRTSSGRRLPIILETKFHTHKATAKIVIRLRHIRIIWTNKMDYFLLLVIYFNNKPLHVSSRLAVHHQEDQHCINSNWYSHAEK